MAKEKEKEKLKLKAPKPTYTPINASLNAGYVPPTPKIKSNLVVSQQDIMPVQQTQASQQPLQVRGALAALQPTKPDARGELPTYFDPMQQMDSIQNRFAAPANTPAQTNQSIMRKPQVLPLPEIKSPILKDAPVNPIGVPWKDIPVDYSKEYLQGRENERLSDEVTRLDTLAARNRAKGLPTTAGMSKDDYIRYTNLEQMRADEKLSGTEKLARSIYTPGAGLSAMQAGYQGASALGSKLLPSVFGGTGMGSKVAAGALTEAALGVPLSAGYTAATNPTSTGEQMASETLKGTLLGAGLGAVGPIAAKGLGAARNAVSDTLRVGKENIDKVESAVAPNRTMKSPFTLSESPSPLTEGYTENVGRTFGSEGQLNRVTPLPVKSTGDRLTNNQVPRLTNNPADEAINAGATPDPAQVAAADKMRGHWFTNLFGDRGLGITAGGTPGGRNTLTTEGQIVNNPLKRDAQGIKDETAAKARAAYQTFVDENAPLNYIDKNVYENAADVRRANNIANTVTQDKFVDLEGNVIGESLKGIMRKVARGKGNEFEDYLILRHAETRMARGENVYAKSLNMTPDKVRQRIAMYDSQYPEFSAIAREWDGYNENLLRTFGEKEGLLSAAQVNAMREANPFYAPMRRQFSVSEKYASPFTASTKGFSGQKAPIKEVSPTGSVRKIVSPIRSTIEATGAWTNAAMRNRVMQTIAAKIRQDPEAMRGIAEIVPETAQMTKKSLDDINEVLQRDGMEGLLESLNDDFAMLFRKSSTAAGKNDNVVRAMVDGQPVRIKIDNPEVLKALVGMGPEQSSIIMDTLGSLSNLTKQGATGALAPLFAARSLIADTTQAMIQSPRPVQHLGDLMHALVSSVANKMPKGTPGLEGLRSLAQDFQRGGGEYSAALMGDRALNQSVRGMKKEPFLSPQNVVNTAIGTVKAPFKLLHGIGDVSENANRMAAYKGSLRKLGGQRTPENIRQAMRDSQEITTNFSRKGSQGRNMEKAVPYTNAAIQGIRRFGLQFKKNPARSLAFLGLGVLLPKFREYAQFSDDPDYQQITARDKYRHLYLWKNDDGTFAKVPMPPEYNGLGALMVDMLQQFKDGDPVNWRQSSDAMVNAYTPPFVGGALQGVTLGGGLDKSIFGALNSTSIAAPIAIASNQSFTGAPIVSERLKNNSPAQQYDERTSEISKFIGEKINMSPMKVDYLIKAYGGDPARLLLPLNSDVGAGTPRNTLFKAFITDPVFTNTLSTDFYDMKKQITQAEADNNNNAVEFPVWYDQKVADTITSQKKGGISKNISLLNEEKRNVQADKSLNAQQKADKLRDIQANINDIYLDAITLMKNGGVPVGR